MAAKKRWNVWRIKNRWLRASFTFVVMTPLVLVVCLVTTVIAVAAGIGEGATYAWWVFSSNRDVRLSLQNYWRAISFQEAA